MVKSRTNISYSPPTPPVNDDLESLSNSELISFLESSFRRSEFIRVAGILKSREELAKGEALGDISIKLSHLEAKNGSLEKELSALRNIEQFGKVKVKNRNEKGRYTLLWGRYERMEKLAQEKIKVLTEEVDKERANCLRLEEQLELEKERIEKKTETDLWKSKYSLLEAWILRFLDSNPRLIEKVREQDMNGEKQILDFFRINRAAEKLLRSDADFDKKDSSLAASVKSKTVIDISSSHNEFLGDSFVSSEKKNSVVSNDKNCSKRKFQIAPTYEVEEVLELDDEDDLVCISNVTAKRFAKWTK